MDCNTKSSILKLRELRDELCGKQSQWKSAFKIKDTLVSELKLLHKNASDPNFNREKIVEKLDALLVLIDPNRQKEREDCDE